MTQTQVAQHPAQVSRNDAKTQGLSRYFTGAPCTRGHIDQRYTSDGRCCECAREKLRKRYMSDPERWRAVSRGKAANMTVEQRAKIATKVREKRKASPEMFKTYDRAKYQSIRNDPDRLKKERARQNEKQKRAYRADPEKYKSISRERHAKNKEKNNQLCKQWKINNPEKVRALNEKWGSVSRANRMKRIPAWLTEDDYKKINDLYKEARRKGMHVDHIIPLQGKTVSGLHVPSNLQLLTPSQNAGKKNKYEVDA